MRLWEKVDSVLLRNFKDHWMDPTITKYLSGTIAQNYEGYLLLFEKQKPLWISHPFNYPQAKKVLAKKARVLTYATKKDLKKLLSKHCKKRIGFNGLYMNYLSVRSFRKLAKGKKLVDVTRELEHEREIKNPAELYAIKKAVILTKKAIRHIKNNLHAGISEGDVASEFKKYFEENKAKTSFCIVAFGTNTRHIHYESGTTQLIKNMPVLIDVGCTIDGYHSDLSESFWFGEKKGKKYEAYHREWEKVKTAQQEIEKLLAPKTPAKKLYTRATQYVGNLPHAIGHGLGIEVHDMPAGIGDKSKWKLREGMVLAIEPALYTKNFGIRLEKNYAITKKGAREL